MPVSEFERHEVFKWLEERMGPERASTMMDLLPPVGWSDIATRRDLEALEARLDAKISERLSDLLLKLFFGMVASNATLVGLVFAAVRLG